MNYCHSLSEIVTLADYRGSYQFYENYLYEIFCNKIKGHKNYRPCKKH